MNIRGSKRRRPTGSTTSSPSASTSEIFDRIEWWDDNPMPARVVGLIGLLAAIFGTVVYILFANYHLSD